MKSIGLFLVIALFVSACNVEKVDTVIVKTSLEEGALSGKIKLNGETLNYQGFDSEEFSIKPQYPKSLSLKLDYIHTADFYKNNFSGLKPTELSMKFELQKVDKDGNAKFRKSGTAKLQGKKFKLTNCTNTVDFNYVGTTLTIDMTKFRSLSDCKLVSKRKNYQKIDSRKNKNGLGKNYFSTKTDKVFGFQAVTDLYSNFSDYIYTDGEMAIHLQEMMDRIAAASERPEVKPNVYFFNAPIENAFALPGGYVFVFRGIIDSLETEAELAGVLGHEWAHVTERHGTESVSRNLTYLAAKILGVGASLVNLGLIGGAATWYLIEKIEDIPLMGFSRLQELEADKLGVQYAFNAGYSPYGLSKFFAAMPDYENMKLKQLLLVSHPNPSTRVEKIEELVFNYLPYDADSIVNSTAYMQAKESMSELEPMPRHKVNDMIRYMGVVIQESIRSSVREKLKVQANKDN